MRATHRAAAVLAAVAAIAAPARADDAACPGRCTALHTSGGTIRLFQPRGYAPRTAGVVVYLHGLYTDVDRAFVEHRLPAQFEASGRNALFIVAGAREQAGDQPPWPSLRALLSQVEAGTRSRLPRGPLVVVGHSGAFSEIALWLAHPRLHTIVLLDGLYGAEAAFAAWLARSPTHRMILVGHGTAAAADAWARRLRFAVRRRELPASALGLTPRERRARLLVIKTAAEHFAIVTDGRALPMTLAWTALPRVKASAPALP